MLKRNRRHEAIFEALVQKQEQRKEFDKKAYEEIEKNRMYNASAKTIISRLLQPVKLARKSFFGS